MTRDWKAIVRQSDAIHPDWTAEDHASFLLNDCFEFDFEAVWGDDLGAAQDDIIRYMEVMPWPAVDVRPDTALRQWR